MAQYFNPVYAILEKDVVIAVQLGVVDEISLVETESGGFYISVTQKNRQYDQYICITRNRSEPKVYSNYNRLFEHLSKTFPTINFYKVYRFNRARHMQEQFTSNLKAVT
jgi:hypothetical protein